MITSERLIWLQKNKEHGDTAAVVKILNPKSTAKGISYAEAHSIITGRLKGKWCNAFCNELERLIKKRIRRQAREAKKYAV